MDEILLNLTVAIPVFNAEKYLELAIKSILVQAYGGFELLLIDDGSTDNSGRICDSFQRMDSRVRVIHQKNKGLVKTRELAVDAARGEYLLFVDADDWLDKDFILALMSPVINKNIEISVGRFVCDYKDRTESVFRDIEPMIIGKDTALSEMFQHRIFGWEICGKIYKKELLRGIIIDKSVLCGEDLLRNWYAFNKVNAVYVSKTCGYHYRQISNSMTSKEINDFSQTIMYPFKCIEESDISMSSKVMESFSLAKLAMMVTSLKVMLIASVGKKFKKQIIEYQNIVRNNALMLLMSDRLSTAQKMGTIFFCLPYSVCKYLYGIIKVYERRRKK